MKYSQNILVNKSGEKVHFFTASLPFTSMKYSQNTLVNKSGEKVHFFSAGLPFISMFNFLEIFIIFSLFKFFAPIFFSSASKAF